MLIFKSLSFQKHLCVRGNKKNTVIKYRLYSVTNLNVIYLTKKKVFSEKSHQLQNIQYNSFVNSIYSYFTFKVAYNIKMIKIIFFNLTNVLNMFISSLPFWFIKVIKTNQVENTKILRPLISCRQLI